MKYIFLLSISLFSCLSPAADKSKKDSLSKDSVNVAGSGGCPCDSSSCSNFYLFQNNYYSLDSLQALVTTVLPATDFQRCSKYKHRFAKNEGWFSDENTIDSVFYKGFLFTVNKKHELLIGKNHNVKTIKLFNAELGNSNTFPTHLLKVTDNGVVVMVDDDDTHYIVGKYDENGKEFYKTIIEHTSITKQGNTDYYEPYLMYIGSTQHEFIFSSDPFTKKQITVVINIDNGVKTEYAFTSGGIIADEQEEKLAGLTEDRDSSLSIHMIATGKTYNVTKTPWAETSETLLCGKLLVISCYARIATGSSLMCVNLETGKTEWTADVLQMNVSHSKYYNNVTLSLYKNKVIMQGDEAFGSYLQFFDVNSGKRLAAFGAVVK